MDFLVILAIIIVVFIGFKFANSTPLAKSCVYFLSGKMGSGKTYIGVDMVLRAWKSACFYTKLYNFFHKNNKKEKPLLLSNVPIGKYKQGIMVDKYSTDLKYEHVVGEIRIPLNSSIFIDEAGLLANQFDFQSLGVHEQATFLRFFRQNIGRKFGKIIYIDQASSEVAKSLRIRCGMVYNLQNFRRWLKFMPFYICEYIPLLIADDSVSNNTNSGLQLRKFGMRKEQSFAPYLFGFMPYKTKRYNTYAFAGLYNSKFEKDYVFKQDEVKELVEPTLKYRKKF